MDKFEEVCWHEAGHAVLAGLHGLSAKEARVRKTADGSDWEGVNRLNGHPESMAIVATGGVAGQLIHIYSDFALVPQADLQQAMQRAREDQVGHARHLARLGQPANFLGTLEHKAWPALLQNRSILKAMAEELKLSAVVGPLVHAAIISMVKVEDAWRAADDEFLSRLPPLPQAPA